MGLFLRCQLEPEIGFIFTPFFIPASVGDELPKLIRELHFMVPPNFPLKARYFTFSPEATLIPIQKLLLKDITL